MINTRKTGTSWPPTFLSCLATLVVPFALLINTRKTGTSWAGSAEQMANSGPLVAIYPGSFDPMTNGHLDLIRRSAKLVDRLIVAVLQNTSKQPLFSVEERKAMLREATANLAHVDIDSFAGLLVDYAELRGAQAIVRGIRAISDYESEMQMALLNRHLRPGTETIFLMAAEEYSFISSRMIKEVITLGGDVSQFVPSAVMQRISNNTRKTGTS